MEINSIPDAEILIIAMLAIGGIMVLTLLIIIAGWVESIREDVDSIKKEIREVRELVTGVIENSKRRTNKWDSGRENY